MHCSVLLPVRNAIDTLDECIDSIRAQTLDAYEVIAVNDGSSDGSRERLTREAARDSRWRVIDAPARGIVAALNAGLAHCCAPLVARMDADDVMLPTRLAHQYELLEQSPDLAVLGCCVELIETAVTGTGFREYVRWQNRCISPHQIDLARFVESPLVHPSVMFRRDLIEQYGGYREGPFAEDYELWLRLLAGGERIGKCPATLLRWRDGMDRLSRSDPRCSDEAFDRLRAAYLARDPRLIEARNRLVIWGAGRKTRHRVSHLLAHNFAPQAWIDIDPRKIGNIVGGARVHPPTALRTLETPFVLSYVRNHGAREDIGRELQRYGLLEGVDWLSVG